MEREPSLLEILTDKIVCGQMEVEEARMIVLRREFYRQKALREHGPISCMPLLKEIERDTIKEVLDRNRWNRTKSAMELGLTKKTLYNKMRKLGMGRIRMEAA